MVSRRKVLQAPALLAAGAQSAEKARTFRLVRDIPVEREYDLVVAGGGPAGAAAAICAARLGAKVLLAEATGCMGGMGTSGLVTAFDPMSDGQRTLAMGFMNEVVTTLYRRGFFGPRVKPKFWEASYMTWTPFNAEGYKLLLDELAVEAGVTVQFFTRVIDVDVEKSKRTVRGAVLSNVEGYHYVPAKKFIDATGDAVLADLCGANCREAGRDTPNIMPATLPSLFAGINWEDPGSRNQQQALAHALADKFFSQPDRHLPGMSVIGKTTGYLNGGHVFGLNALRTKSLTDGMMLGRRLAQEYMEFYRKYVPGFEKIEHVTTASVMGVRESRRIAGEYELKARDHHTRRQFSDQIGVFNKAIDIHPYNNSEEEFKRYEQDYLRAGRMNPGECFGIPYGILVPRGWTNLWVAGRCTSSDVAVHGSIRVQPAASMMGQAAGTAAVQSLETGQPACDLDTEKLVTTLREHKAYLPQERLSKKMTRDSAP